MREDRSRDGTGRTTDWNDSMSMRFGDDAVTDPATMRGRSWPCLRQFCVFLENRVGRLHELLRKLERQDLRVMALSIVDSADCATVRLLVDNFERGREVLNLSGFFYFENDIIGVELPDTPQPYVTICSTLLQAEVNIHYTYPLLYRRHGRGAIVLFVDDIDAGLNLLREKGHRIVTESELLEDDEYF